MLETIGVSSLDELIAQTVPDDIRQRVPLDLGTALSETEALEKARELAARNLQPTQDAFRKPSGNFRRQRRHGPQVGDGHREVSLDAGALDH